MRVGYLTYGLDSAPTGIGRYSVQLLEALAAQPDRPEIVVLSTEKTDPFGLWTRFEHYGLSGVRRLPALLTLGNGLLSWAARHYKLDIIHDPNGIAPFIGPANGACRVVTVHDTFPFVYPQFHNRLDNWRYHWLLPHTLRKASLVLTDSRNSQQDIQRYFGVSSERILAVPLGVDPSFRPIAKPETVSTLDRYGLRQPYLLYVGALNARKNLTRLLQAFVLLRPRFPELKLVINGKRQWRLAEFNATFEQLQLDGQVIFTGYVADADLPSLYTGASLFVFPSLYEGFGLPVLEAMACGTPVVASNASALPEVLGEAALLVDPFDVKAIAQAIEKGLSDEKLRAELRQRGLEQAAKYTWQQTAHETLAAYRRVLK